MLGLPMFQARTISNHACKQQAAAVAHQNKIYFCELDMRFVHFMSPTVWGLFLWEMSVWVPVSEAGALDFMGDEPMVVSR